jgi:hypothetical protein
MLTLDPLPIVALWKASRNREMRSNGSELRARMSARLRRGLERDSGSRCLPDTTSVRAITFVVGLK